jgi:hypothetical protein
MIRRVEKRMSGRRGRFIFNGVRNRQEHGRFLHQASYGTGPISVKQKALKRRRIESISNQCDDAEEILDCNEVKESPINYEALIRFFATNLGTIPKITSGKIEKKIREMIRDSLPLSDEYRKFAEWKGISLEPVSPPKPSDPSALVYDSSHHR